jgi:hypothetical protein
MANRCNGRGCIAADQIRGCTIPAKYKCAKVDVTPGNEFKILFKHIQYQAGTNSQL